MLCSSSEIVQIKYFKKRKMYWINASEVGQVKQLKSTTAQVKGGCFSLKPPSTEKQSVEWELGSLRG